MRTKLQYILITIFPLVVMTGCMLLGLNVNHKTLWASKIPSFTKKDSLKGANNSYRSCYDVKFYDIALSIDPKKKVLSGYATTFFQLKQTSKTIQLDLDHQFIIDSIIQNFSKLKFTRKYTAIFLDLVSTDEFQSVTVYYHGSPKTANRPPWEGGFVWKKDKNKKPWIGVCCEGDGSQTWLPIKMYLGDEPDSVSTHFTVNSDLVAVSNGVLQNVAEKGNQKTYHWKTRYPTNPYNVTVYVGDFREFEIPYTCIDGSKMMMKFYVLPENLEKAKEHFKQTERILHVYEKLFGKYPWQKEEYKLIESPYEGMEHQTAIAYGHGYKNQPGQQFDYIILHESAHEWWGNAVSVNDFSDVWIHEGMATYAEALYVEQTEGYPAYLDYVNWTAVTVMNKKPIIGPRDTYYWNYKDGDIYNKGAIAMHTLRCYLQNDSLFFQILKKFWQQHEYGFANTKDFIDLVNKETKEDLNWFFAQYFYRRESPFLKWNYHYDSQGKSQLVVKYERVDMSFKLPVKVRQKDKAFFVYPSVKETYFDLPYPSSERLLFNSDLRYLQEGYKKVK